MPSSVDNFTGLTIVMDTSVCLMSSPREFNDIQGATVVIPLPVVEELESKRSDSNLGFYAREWIRFIEELRCVGSIVDGTKNKGKTTWKVHDYSLEMEEESSLTNDNRILANALYLTNEKDTILLSNDTPMRILATFLSKGRLKSQPYTSSIDKTPFSGSITITVSEGEYDSVFSSESNMYSLVKAVSNGVSRCHVRFIMDETGQHCGDYIFDREKKSVKPLTQRPSINGIKSRNTEQSCLMNYLKNEDILVLSVGGRAGSGKTSISIAHCVNENRRKDNQKKIIVLRSLHEMGQGQETGFLPGTIEEKMAPWAGAVYDAIDFIVSSDKKMNTPEKIIAEKKRLRELVEVQPITHLRGRSIADSYIILEECQNFSRNEILNILSRTGQGSRVIMTFDSTQVDNRFLKSGDKSDVWSVIEDLKDQGFFGHITLNHSERSIVAETVSSILEKDFHVH